MRPRAERRLFPPAIATAVVASVLFASVEAVQETPAPKPQPAKGVVIRGCLTGSKLTHLDPQNLASPDVALKLPDTLKVTSIRVIRSQVKALNGHQVEITGSLRGIPGI